MDHTDRLRGIGGEEAFEMRQGIEIHSRTRLQAAAAALIPVGLAAGLFAGLALRPAADSDVCGQIRVLKF